MKFFTLILLVGLLTFFQVLGFSVFGVKPNLALAVVIAASFFIASFWEGFLLVVLAALILKFSPGFAMEILVFALIGTGAIIIKNYLPWRNFLNNLFLVAAGTFVFYLILSPDLILSAIFAKELFLNLVAGISIFAL
ncbi:MAG: hypothetical protein AAB707_01355, partial [Patescibacteria group bacterium]